MTENKRPERKEKAKRAAVAEDHAVGVSSLGPPIPHTCVGGTRVACSDRVECLGEPVFLCEHWTAIESSWFCHHPRALEIAARTEEARKKAAEDALKCPSTDASQRLVRIFSGPPL